MADNTTPTAPTMRAFDDVQAEREALFTNVQRAVEERFPMTNQRYTLHLKDVGYRRPRQYTLAEQKRAIMRGQTLGWGLMGRWELIDNASGKIIDKTNKRLIAQVPYLTDRGTFIFNGTEYTVASQMRLRPGIYSRIKDNGIIESHFNVKGGTGRSFRVYMEPTTGVFRMNIGQANLKLYPILRSMGIDDRALNSTWGPDLLQANIAATDPRAVQRAYNKLVSKHPTAPTEQDETASEIDYSDTDTPEEKAAYDFSFNMPTNDIAGYGKQTKVDVNYTMAGFFQQCGRCANFNGLNACKKVQGFIADSGWCVLWRNSPFKFAKVAQEDENRARVRFIGELVCDDSTAGKEWAYLKVHEGLPEAAYEALKDQGIECDAHHDNPHISVLRNNEAKQLIVKYGKRWKAVCGHGRKFPFSLQNAIVDLDPEGWKEMERVWFLEAKSPELRAHRKSLGLSELPRGDESGDEFQFHITVAVKPKKQARGASKIAALFDSVEVQTAAAFAALIKASYEVVDDALVKSATAIKLSEVIDQSVPSEPAEPMELIEQQQQAAADLRGNPAEDAIKLRRNLQVLKQQKTLGKRYTTLEELKAMLPTNDVKQAFVALLGREETFEKHANDRDMGEQMRAIIAAMEVDPDTVELTTGKRFNKLSPEVIVEATKKLIDINRRNAETDDRDSLAFQQIYGPEDLFAERVSRDAGGISRKLLWRATNRGNVSNFPSSALSPQLRLVLLKSGLAAPLEEVNPLEIFDQLVRVTRMGEGGMPGLDAVPDEARAVQPSHFGIIDPIRAPEGMKIGVDSRMTHRTYKGSDGNVYLDILNVRSGKPERVSAKQLTQGVVAFPGELAKDSHEVRAMIRGKKLAYVKREDVDYELPHTSQMFTATSNMVPMVSAVKGGRLLMGAKMSTQSLPLKDAEAPLVQNLADDGTGRSFEDIYGERAGAVVAKDRGVVTDMAKDKIVVKYANGEKVVHDMYDNFPFNRKTFVHNTPVVKIGDTVAPGQLLAKSNFTDNSGTIASGLNLRVAYLPYRGYNADDAIVLSESAAKRLSSEHMYTTKYENADNQEAGKRPFLSLFPGRFDKQQLSTIDDSGIVKIGTKVKYGDPLMLAVSQRKPSGGGMLRARKTLFSDIAETWDHESEGVVTDVDKTKDGWKVIVKAYSPMHVGDKLSNRYGGKGVVSKIVPDDQMIHDKDGKPFDITLSPLGIVSRTNPAQLIEVALSKVAKKTGTPYRVPGFTDENYITLAKKELQKHGLSDTEDIYDPISGRKIPKVFTGYAYMMKLHHMAEPKLSGRDIGAYTAEGQPAGGGPEGSKRIGMGEMMALISHGATDVIRDAKLVRGQRNDDFWRALRLGYTPASPKVPLIYNKFLHMLQASGINLKKQGERLHLFAMTDKDVDKLSAGPLKNSETVTGDRLEPESGGLFDVGLTGGHGGMRWTHVDLAEPMPNPVMEEPIRRMLGLTQDKLEKIIAGKETINGETGSNALVAALKRIKVPDALDYYTAQVKDASGAQRDNAIKVLGYLRTLQKAGQTPSDLMVTKVPIIPPNFRPITSAGKNVIYSDFNYLYKDLMGVNSDLATLKSNLNDEQTGDERLRLYKAYKAITGLGDPVGLKTKEKVFGGLLRHIFGTSPKLGMFQQRVLGAAVDTVGRGVITPNPSLGMDQVGLPESKAWVLYRPFVMRNLIRRGMPAMAAAKAVENQDPVAYKALLDETATRPVIINRAPVLHRYGMMAAWPILTKGNTLQIPPIVTPGFNADFDGDAMNFHVPVSKAAVEEAVNKMMPSRNLLSASDFDVHYFPKQEFLHGLYIASTSKNKQTKTFMTKQDVLKAYRRGELNISDVVQFGK